MKDYIFYANLIMLVFNVVTFIYLMSVKDIYLRSARVVLLAAIFIGMIANLGKLTIWNVLFAFAPFITLSQIQQHGKLSRLIERIRGNRWRNNERVQGMQGHSQGHNKALSKQKA